MRLQLIVFLSIFMMFVFSCNNQKGEIEDIIPQRKMERIIWDMYQASIYANDYIRQDSLSNDSLDLLEMKKTILSHHQISENKYNESYQYYLNHPQLMSAIIDSITLFQQKKQKTKPLLKEFKLD